MSSSDSKCGAASIRSINDKGFFGFPHFSFYKLLTQDQESITCSTDRFKEPNGDVVTKGDLTCESYMQRVGRKNMESWWSMSSGR